MDRRNFLKNTCNIACACATVSVMSVLQSCEDNIDDTYNSNDSGNDDGTSNDDNQIVINISESPHTALMQVSGTSSLGSNSIDSLGILLVRSSVSRISAFSRRCTHASYDLYSFNSNGQAVCSSGHGGSFGTNGNVINGPPNTSLESYSTSLIENQLTITK